MDRPVRFFSVVCAVQLAGAATFAQQAAASAAPEAPVPRRERLVSARTAQLIAASLPKYTPPTGATDTKPAVRPRLEPDRPANGIVRLPDYIVREPRLPTPEQVMTRKAIAEYAMKKYLGPSDGFDRGFLNAVTISDLQKKIPVLGFLLGLIPHMSNEERAMMYYYEEKRLQDMKDLMEMASLPGPNGDTANDARLKREVRNTFRRD